MKRFLPICLLLLPAACGEQKSAADYGYYFEKLMLTTQGHVRGHTLGESMQTVKQRETSPLSDESDHYLYYNGTLDENSHYILSFYFDDNALYEINLDVFTGSEETAGQLYTSLLAYLNNQYGDPEKNGSLSTWKAEDNGQPLEISLAMEETENEGGFITMSTLRGNQEQV